MSCNHSIWEKPCLSPADAGLDLDLWYIENILTDNDTNTFKHQDPVAATLSPLGNSQNSKWQQRRITPFYEATVKVCTGQKSAFLYQKDS